MISPPHETALTALAHRLALGNSEERVAAEVLCLVGACLRKGCVSVHFAEVLEAAYATLDNDEPESTTVSTSTKAP